VTLGHDPYPARFTTPSCAWRIRRRRVWARTRARDLAGARAAALAPPRRESSREPPGRVATADTNIKDLKAMPGNSDIGPQALDSLHPVYPECYSPVRSRRPSTATRIPSPCKQGGDV
tara:strand:- start:14 stop:367 length:354 start_codon:yes stop_codon:yes gene_type:complete